MRAALDAPIRTSAAVLDRVVASGRPVLIVFEAPDCGPCVSLLPVLDELAREFRDRVLIVRVVDSREGWLAARYHLSFVPTLAFCREGVETTRIKGNPGLHAIRAHLEFLLDGKRPPDPAEGPRHTLSARFGRPPRRSAPRGLLRPGSAVR
jgi:thioredoxin 1